MVLVVLARTDHQTAALRTPPAHAYTSAAVTVEQLLTALVAKPTAIVYVFLTIWTNYHRNLLYFGFKTHLFNIYIYICAQTIITLRCLPAE